MADIKEEAKETVSKEKKPKAEKKPAAEKKKAEPAKAVEKKVEAPKAAEAPKPAAAPVPAPASQEKKAKKPARKKTKVALAKGKRKEAIARAVISPGKGRFTFNRSLVDSLPNRYIREIIREPLNFLGAELGSMDINVSVRGGGQMGQAQAARSAIAKALVEYTQDEKLKNSYLDYDRSLLVDDVRRVEPKKYKGPKARARFQKSYR